MGPQLYRCGNDGRRHEGDHRLDASMGPQLYRCGNASQLQPEPGRACALQWGRNFIVAETAPPLQSCSPPWQRFNGAATLSLRKQSGPSDALQLRIRLNGAATLSLRKLANAVVSMTSHVKLQWGRNFIVAETSPGDESGYSRYSLQWGRNFIVAETSSRRGNA